MENTEGFENNNEVDIGNTSAKVASKVGILGMVMNTILLVGKFIVGIAFNSHGLIADAVNSFGDVFSSIVTYVGGKISSKPKDDTHEFGHGKAEIVAAFLIGIFMTVVSIQMIYNSLMSIIHKEEFSLSVILIAIPAITIIIKLLMYLYVAKIGKKEKSLLINANAKDHRNDTILSTGVLLGLLAGYYGYYFADGIVGILISLIIILTGVKIIYEAYDILIDKSIDKDISEAFKKEIKKVKGVNHVDSIISKPTGNMYMLVVKVSVDPLMTVRDSHKIAGKIREKLKNKDGIYDAVVHINPDD